MTTFSHLHQYSLNQDSFLWFCQKSVRCQSKVNQKSNKTQSKVIQKSFKSWSKVKIRQSWVIPRDAVAFKDFLQLLLLSQLPFVSHDLTGCQDTCTKLVHSVHNIERCTMHYVTKCIRCYILVEDIQHILRGKSKRGIFLMLE